MRPGPRGVTRARMRPPFRGFRPQRASPGALPGAPVQAAEGRLVPIPRRRRAQAPQSGVGRRGACPSSHIARSPHHSDASNRPFTPVRGPRRPRAARLDHVARLGRLTLIRLIEATCKAKPPFRKFQSTHAHRLSPTNHNRTRARRARSTKATLTSARATARRNPAPRTSPSQHESPSA